MLYYTLDIQQNIMTLKNKTITVLVHAESVESLNERIQEREWVIGKFPPIRKKSQRLLIINDLPTGSIIKIYARYKNGKPLIIAKGKWNEENCQVV